MIERFKKVECWIYDHMPLWLKIRYSIWAYRAEAESTVYGLVQKTLELWADLIPEETGLAITQRNLLEYIGFRIQSILIRHLNGVHLGDDLYLSIWVLPAPFFNWKPIMVLPTGAGWNQRPTFRDALMQHLIQNNYL